ncbi:DUF2989 domain-containing protein [Shewanella avicenniae]|uniref:DUF2989 domain-containing protein n=1 Tax=Shewanella avicenniae TaxID=2814294 RepID=A0ABX7QWQ2_9GAMM|nr:DUF2989 domain-containing protein [Shewanella avicenniae]QSX35325.1 DUF2989 domain-containing protein [Shewanella avicenniae]
MTRFFVIITSFCFISLLEGCDRLTPTEKICKNNPEICEDLHTDGWCRTERATLVSNRLVVKEAADKPDDKQLYDLIVSLEGYNKCMWRASGVQHINNPERTDVRARAYALSAQSLTELQDSVRDAKTPYLSYYRWTRLGDENALYRLIEAETEHPIQDATILAALAAHYLEFNAPKSLQLYLRALSLDDDAAFKADWLLGMARGFALLNKPEQQYLLEKTNLVLTERQANEQQLEAVVGGHHAVVKQLNEQAEAFAEVLKDNEFSKSVWPKRLAADIQTSQ